MISPPRLGLAAATALCFACGPSTPTEAPSPTGDNTPGADPTPTSTATATATMSPTSTATPSRADSPTPSAAPSPTQLTPSPTTTPSASPTQTPGPSGTPSPTMSPTPSPTEDPRCDPALGLSPEQVELATLSVYTFMPRGGTGAWRFELVENGSGAILNEITGAYISGGVAGARDRIRLWDLGCEGEAFAEVQIRRPLTVRPSQARIVPGGAMTFDVLEGSGRYTCSLTQGGSDPTLTEDCRYTAGDTPGYDQILVEDLGTLEQAIVDVDVRGDAGPYLDAEAIFIPLGSRAPLRVEGGSGWIDATLEGEGLRIEDGTLFADAPGAATLSIVDAYTQGTAQARVHALPSLGKPLQWVGDRQMSARAIGPGDINGDGHPDAILAMPESDLAAYNGGAIFIFEGDGNGALLPEPARVILGAQWEGELGRDLKVEDLDGDGLKELIVGAPREDWGANDTGGVYIYRGISEGFFEPEASLILQGESGSDWFGYGVASCDLDGDGWADLAIGAIRDQNNDIPGIPTDTGAIHLFLGGPEGFAPAADRILYGVIPNGEGGILPWKDLRAGDGIEAGDLNGDGLCDLAVSAWQYDTPAASNSGMVFAYLGRVPSEGESFGMGPNPDVSIESFDVGGEGAQLGRRIALGDLDQDGMDELVINHWFFDGAAGNRAGALRLFNGRADFDSLGWIAAEDADLSIEGDDANDYMGFAMAPGDVDGDGEPELLVGELQGETDTSPSSVGRVIAFKTSSGLRPGSIYGEYTLADGNASDFVGEAIAALVDDDGVGEGTMLVLAGRDDTYGYDVGRPYVMGEGMDPIPLNITGNAGGIQFGRSVAVLETGVAVGAPLDDPPENGANDGTVTLFDLSAPEAPTQTLQDFEGHSGSDQFGYFLTKGGDFDGDGLPDLAVAALQEEAPNTFGSAYYNPEGCVREGTNTGALLLFRGLEDGTIDQSPAFFYVGPQPSTRISTLAGDFDFNGDGLDDLAAASYDWDGSTSNIGGVSVLLGRQPSTDAIEAICSSELLVLGSEDGGQLGYAITQAGDLNQDGCDDLALGAPFVDTDGLTNQGQVLLLFGYGGEGCPEGPTGALLFSGVANTQLGSGLSGGYDIDGDGIPDLAIGARNNQVGDDRPGSVFLVSGASLGSLTPSPLISGEEMDLGVAGTLSTVDVIATLHGTVHASLFGQSVALIPGLSGPGLAGLAVGEPLGSESGDPLTGGVKLYRFEGDDMTPITAGLLIGEADHVDNRIGEFVSAGLIDGRPVVTAGGYRGSGFGQDVGSVYVMDLSMASDVP